MINSKVFILIVFTIALGAGITIGRLWERSETRGELTKGPAFIAKELNLTQDQDVKMHAIWSKVLDARSKHHFRIELIQREKEDKVEDLLKPDQKEKFHDVIQEYDRKQGDIERERRAKRDALAKEREDAIRGVLAADQKAEFDTVVKQFDAKRQELDQNLKATENNAVAETTKLLDENQRKKFEQMRKSRDESLGKTPSPSITPPATTPPATPPANGK